MATGIDVCLSEYACLFLLSALIPAHFQREVTSCPIFQGLAEMECTAVRLACAHDKVLVYEKARSAQAAHRQAPYTLDGPH